MAIGQMKNGDLALAVPAITRETLDDGSIVLSNDITLGDITETMLDKLDHWVHKLPNMVFLRERDGDGWNEISYGEFHARVQDYAARLLPFGLCQESPLLILSPNTINHALIAFAAMSIGVPIAPISPAYALVAKTFGRLEQIIDILKPGAIYVSDPKLFKKSVDALTEKLDIPILSSRSGHDAVKILADCDTASEDDVATARRTVTLDTVAKVMFTSGSTGVPKGVINSHRMLYSNQAALAKLWPFLNEAAPSIVDWLPWSHTFGGNVCFNVILFHGGTLNIDDGKPMPARVGRTVENLSMGMPNLHFNVPAGIEALLPHLENDAYFAKRFFTNMKVVFVAAAALPQEARNRLNAAAIKAVGTAPKLLAGWGSTETAPFSTCVYFPTDRADNIGLPMPGTQLKLTPDQDKMGLSVKGPNVTAGYWRNDKATAAAFSDDGFYAMGDAGYLINADDPSRGIAFDGRLTENFKLLSGTWVNVGKLRISIIDSLRPLCIDAVITGHNTGDIGLLLVPNYKYFETEFDVSLDDQNAAFLLAHDAICAAFNTCINTYNSNNRSNSTNVKRFTIIPRLPEIDRNEITDKGYLNQRALLENWSDLVANMHRESDDGVILFRNISGQ